MAKRRPIHIHLSATLDAGWDENKHPRNHGQFSSKPGAAGKSGEGSSSALEALRKQQAAKPGGDSPAGMSSEEAAAFEAKFPSVTEDLRAGKSFPIAGTDGARYVEWFKRQAK